MDNQENSSDISSPKSKLRPSIVNMVSKVDRMKQLFHKIRSLDSLSKEHILDLVNTMTGRKKMKFTLW